MHTRHFRAMVPSYNVPITYPYVYMNVHQSKFRWWSVQASQQHRLIRHFSQSWALSTVHPKLVNRRRALIPLNCRHFVHLHHLLAPLLPMVLYQVRHYLFHNISLTEMCHHYLNFARNHSIALGEPNMKASRYWKLKKSNKQMKSSKL